MDSTSEYRGFMYAASKDVLAVEALAQAGLADHCEAIAFHCQQAAEKMVKNVFPENGQVPPKSHDVGDLLSTGISAGWFKAGEDAIQAAIDLSLYAVAARYESSPDISEGEARKAIRDCNLVARMLAANELESIEIGVADKKSVSAEPDAGEIDSCV